MLWWKYVLVAVMGYLLGGINFATIFAKLNKKDIRTMGSGNPGTMNVVRNLGAKWGALTFLGDALKGVVPALTGLLIEGEIALYAGGLSAVVGHIYPVYNKFKGGKGVATAIGVFFVANPILSLISLGIFFVMIIFTEYSSLSSLTFVTILTVEQGFTHSGIVPISIMLFVIWVLVWFGHRSNIVHLIIGTERKSHIIKALSKIKEPKKKNKKNDDK